MSWLFDRLTDLAVADHLTIVVDVAEAEPDRAELGELDPMLRRARRLSATEVEVGSRCPRSRSSCGARFVASGGPAAADLFASLGQRDLGVSVGGTAPGAELRVDSMADLASILDAMVTLRSYAQREAV